MKKRIMIIDDEKEFLEQFGEMMGLSGYEPLLCQGGKAGLENLFVKNPDLVLLDLNMDDVDGFDVAKQIKLNPATHNIPIIIISGQLTEQSISRLEKEDGATFYLRKPVKPLDIISKIESIFSNTN